MYDVNATIIIGSYVLRSASLAVIGESNNIGGRRPLTCFLPSVRTFIARQPGNRDG
jgi:hypothetical protein